MSLTKEEAIKLESAKSWFVLAQLCIILAGFLFASGSLHFNAANQAQQNAVETIWDPTIFGSEYLTLREWADNNPENAAIAEAYINSSFELAKFKINYSANLLDVSRSEISLWGTYEVIGVISLGFSFIFFLIGKINISKI